MGKMEGFGQRLKEERKRLYYTQKELADKLGITPLSISKYENGDSYPHIRFIYSLAPLSFDIGYILLGERVSKEMTIEIRKKMALALDTLEIKLGYKLSSLSRTKAIVYLKDHFTNIQDLPLPDGWYIDFIKKEDLK